MKYRQRTGDYTHDGKVFDVYAETSSKKKALMKKKKLKSKYDNIRILKRKKGYEVVVR